jgi:hypothetical protein
MPGTIPQSEIMQPAGDFHHHVTDTVAPAANFFLHDPASLHTADRMLYPHFLARNATVFFFLFWREFTTAWLLGWLSDGYGRNGKALKPHVLIEHAASGQFIPFIIGNRFFMPFPCMRRTHILNSTRLFNQKNVL